MEIQTVTIVGVGLIGGSFGMALREAGFRGRIVGVSSPATLQAALERGAIDSALPLSEALAASDLVYLAQPIARILDLLPEVAQGVPANCLVTDAGSTKRAVVQRAAEVFGNGATFLGGHPMAGKAQRGVENAEANLFQGAVYVLTPRDGRLPDLPAAKEFLSWIERIGAKPLILAPDVHDEVVTWTSHLPQVVSSALALSVSAHLDEAEHFRVAGPGLRDMTRLAESSYDIWKDIMVTNGDNLQRALEQFLEKLKHFRDHLATAELKRDFEAARKVREKLFPT